MKRNLATLSAALCTVALLGLASCSSERAPKDTSSSSTTVKPGVPGGTNVQTHTTTAIVTDVNARTRELTIKDSTGEKTTLQCGPEMINFDQIRQGDHVKMVIMDSVEIAMASATTPTGAVAAGVAAAPKGQKPAGVIAASAQITAKVVAIDLKTHQATLQFPDGTQRTVAVRPDVDLTKRQVGERVLIRTTQAISISVEKP